MDDRSRALAKSRDELRPLAEWFWDGLDASPIRSRNELAKRAGYDKNTVYAVFDGQRLIDLVQARDLADTLGAELADLDKFWRAARRASGSSASGSRQAWETTLRTLTESPKVPQRAFSISAAQGDYVPWMTPSIDHLLIDRRALISSVTDLLTKYGADAVGLTAALAGAGGFGKTTLALQVCSRPEVRQRFPGGLLWATIGQERETSDIAGIINDLCRHLSGNRPDFANADQAGYYFGHLLNASPATLIVIDDVWDSEQLRPFRYGGESATRLVISRQANLLPSDTQTVIVDEMRPEESRILLCAGLPDLPAESIDQLLRLAGNWPLLLALTNGFLRRSAQPVNAARIAAQKLSEDGPTALDIRVGASRDKAVSRTVQVSIQLLSYKENYTRYRELGIFAENDDIPLEVISLLWNVAGAMSTKSVNRLRQELVELSLVQSPEEHGQITRIHSILREYLRHETGDTELSRLNSEFIKASRNFLKSSQPKDVTDPWWLLPASADYLRRHLCYHLNEAQCMAELTALVCDLRWVDQRIVMDGVAAVEADLGRVDNPLAVVLRRALANQAHLLGPIEPEHSHSSILVSRLDSVPELRQPVQAFVSSHTSEHPQLTNRWPLQDYEPALLHVLSGHTGPIAGVAVAPNSAWLATTGRDNTVRIWDATTAAIRATLRGHTSWVTGVAIAPDNTWLATTSRDNTVRIWDPNTEEEVAVLRGHTSWVTGVALCVRIR